MTIEVPTPSADLISQIETATIEANEITVAAIAAIRERFTCYAKHNGNINISYEQTCHASCSGEGTTEWEFLREAGRKIKGLLCYDSYRTEKPIDEHSGIYTGERLWLTDQGQWIQVTRSGIWSEWQGSSRSWQGDVRRLTDAQVATEYAGNIGDILKDLGISMSTMCKKLPERYGTLKARAELAQRIVDGLKA